MTTPRRPSTAALATLSTLLVLAAGLAASPAPAAPATSGQAASPDGKPNVRVTKVTATSTPTTTGTTVATTLRLKNVTPTRKSTRNTRLSLTDGNGTFRLGKAVVQPIPAKGRTTVRVSHTVKLKVPAGLYAVRACRGPLDDETCRTSAATVTVAPAALVAAPAALALGDVRLGAAPARRDVTITNGGQTPTGALTTAVSGDHAFSIAASTCTSSLLPGASCTVSAVFTPGSPGAAQGTLAVTGATAGVTSVALTGNGLGAPVLAISKAAHAFGDTVVGSTSAPVQLTVTNTGNIPSGTPTVALAPAATDDFEISANTCTAALAPAATCSVSVTFSPQAAGERTAGVDVTATPGGSATTALSGTGLAPAALTLAPGSLAFGNELLDDTTDTQTATLTNSGDVASGVPTIALSGDDADQFTIVDNGCTAAVPADGSCDIDVAFAPTASGAASASLTASATPGGTTSATLGGTGQAPAELSISETAYDFGYIDDPAEHTFTVTNNGDSTSGVPVVELGGSDAFAVTSTTCGSALAGHVSCTVGVTYTGSGSTQQSAELSVAATPGGTVTADMTGFPVALTVAPTSHDFGGVLVGSSSDTQSFTLTNHRLTPVQVDGEGVTGPFPLDTSCFALVLPAGGTCTFSVHFAPTSAGPASGFLDYFAQGGHAQLDVFGEGLTPAAFSFSPSTVDFGAYAPGDFGTRQLTVTNTGTQASNAISFAITGADASEFYGDSTDCPTALAGGASCTVTVGFAPTALGDKTAAFAVGGAPGGVISLVGLAAPAGVSLASYDYGAQPVGSTTQYAIRLVNTTGTARYLSSLTYSSTFVFESQTFTCYTLPANGSCLLTFSFRPTTPGYQSSVITVTGQGFSATATLSGTGVAAPAAGVTGFAAQRVRPMPTSVRLRDGKVEVLDN